MVSFSVAYFLEIYFSELYYKLYHVISVMDYKKGALAALDYGREACNVRWVNIIDSSNDVVCCFCTFC